MKKHKLIAIASALIASAAAYAETAPTATPAATAGAAAAAPQGGTNWVVTVIAAITAFGISFAYSRKRYGKKK